MFPQHKNVFEREENNLFLNGKNIIVLISDKYHNGY